MLALEIDNENRDEILPEDNDDPTVDYRKSFYILDSNWQIHLMERMPYEPMFTKKRVFKLS